MLSPGSFLFLEIVSLNFLHHFLLFEFILQVEFELSSSMAKTNNVKLFGAAQTFLINTVVRFVHRMTFL